MTLHSAVEPHYGRLVHIIRTLVSRMLQPIGSTGPGWLTGLPALSLRLVVIYAALVWLCDALGPVVLQPFAALFQALLSVFVDRYDIHLQLLEHQGQWLISGRFATCEPMLIGGQVLPAGAAVDASTLAGHVLQPLLIVLSVAISASFSLNLARIRMWLAAVLGTSIVILLDTPLVLLGNVDGLIADAVGDARVQFTTLWADFLENGGRLMFAVCVALLCVIVSARPPQRSVVASLHAPTSRVIGVVLISAALFLSQVPLATAAAENSSAKFEQKVVPALWAGLMSGTPQEVLVLFRHADIDTSIAVSNAARGLVHDDSVALEARASSYAAVKEGVRRRFAAGTLEWLRDYRHLPVMFVRVPNAAVAQQMLVLDDVAALMPNLIYYSDLAESLPLIKQADSLEQGLDGTGRGVAVIDSGVDYTRAAFGSCTAPGVPAACKVLYAADIAPDDGSRDTSLHGTHVAGIALGVAPGASIIALDVFNSSNLTDASLLTDAINWTIANQSSFNIAVLNMSLSDGVKYTSACSNPVQNPLKAPLDGARNAGMLVVAASGNNGYTNGIANPACTPGVISVGAVYDANLGSRTWNLPCTDSTTAADKVVCFSNSASFLSVLAPGAVIVAASLSSSGTSMATPHLAGAGAVLRAAYPTATLTELETKLKTSDTAITDSRNNVTKPRLDLRRALGDVNDAFAAALILSGSSNGNVSIATQGATVEPNEPSHAGVAGGASVWWNWTPAASGWVQIDTTGSNFDTLLGVYTGTALMNLTAIASNDNRSAGETVSSVAFYATQGVTYRIAVDGKSAATGNALLNWVPTTAPPSSGLDEDIPLLPSWALVALGAGLVSGGLAHARRGQSNAPRARELTES